MNTPTIEMDRAEAQRQVDLYRQSVKRRASATDRLLLRGYKRLAAGQRLIDVIEVFRATEYDELCRPRLAIARATATWTHFSRTGSDTSGRFVDQPREAKLRATHEFPEGTFKTWRQLNKAQIPRQYWGRSRARVPMIPIHLRPADSLRNYFLLFEAEWEMIAPRDPLLLKQLHENIFVVVAEWNLSELERAVLQGMMRKEQTT